MGMPIGNPEDRKAHATAPSKWRRAVNLLTMGQHTLLLISTGARIFVGFCDLALAASMYLLFLLMQQRAPQHHLWWMPNSALNAAMLTAILVAVRAIADMTAARFTFRQIQLIYSNFLLRLTEGYSRMRWSKFVERNRSELLNRAINTARDAADFYHRFVEMTSGVVVVSVLTAALVYQSPIAAIAFACTLAAYYLMHQAFASGKIQLAAINREDSLASLQRNVMGILSSGKEIRTYDAYAHFGARIEHQAEQLALHNRRATFLPEVMRIIADQGVVLAFLSAIVAAELWHGDQHRLLSLLAFYFVLSRRLIPLVSQLSLIAGQMQSSYESVRIVATELNECEEFIVPRRPAITPSVGFALELHSVSVGSNQHNLILSNVNLRLRSGEMAVLYGPSGIGKSSLIDLIAGVAQPATGTIQVDRSTIAYVPQDAPLLDDSIRTNLLFGLPQRSENELMEALRLARFDTFVANLPLALDTKVGDNGARLSGGERQRLGLARAILRGTKLLLLDEATSALEEDSEHAILQNLIASGRTILLATHRTASRALAHRVLRIERGTLVEDAPTHSLTSAQKITAEALG
jgi:ABC-type multidrug transport system fused ATPase/permease subunit